MSYTAMYRRFRPTTFEEVKGQDAIVTTLKNQIRSDRIGHAYLFCGTRGTGKTSIAKLFAKSVNCEHPVDGSPCGECASCKAIAEGRSMNVVEIDAASNNGVDNIREIVNEVAYSPTEGKYRVYIIDEVHMLSTGAFNALLKTLEEPPSYAVILLLTTNQEAFLPTILSRCVQLKLKPLRDFTVKKYLTDTLHVEEADADIYAAFARGNLGKAISLASSEDFKLLHGEMLHLLKHVKEMDISELLDYIRKMKEENLDIYECLDFMQLWYRDVLLYKVARDMNQLIFKDEYSSINEMGQKCSYEGLEKILQAIDKARIRLDANVNMELAMELMLLVMKEQIDRRREP